MPNGRCYRHGGATPAGIASPQYKTGRYSKVLPARLLETYERSISDNELLVQRDDIAIVDSRLAELLARLDSGESGANWKRALTEYAALQDALDGVDPAGVRAALAALGGAIRRGLADYAVWAEVSEALELRRRLVESERKRLVQLSQMITVEQAMVYSTAILSLVKENVDDPRVLARISDGLRRLAAAGSERA